MTRMHDTLGYRLPFKKPGFIHTVPGGSGKEPGKPAIELKQFNLSFCAPLLKYYYRYGN